METEKEIIMSKLLEVKRCQYCPHCIHESCWGNSDFVDSYGTGCSKAHRRFDNGVLPVQIPSWCPLPNAAHGEDSKSKSVMACNKLFAHALEQILRIIGHGHYEERLVIKQLAEYQVKETENGASR